MKRVLITQACSNIGQALTTQYLQLGWFVYACAGDGQRLQSMCDSVQLVRENCLPLTVDVTERDACRAIAEYIEGELTLVILSTIDGQYLDTPQPVAAEVRDLSPAANLLSLGFCLEAFLPKVMEGGRVALMGASATPSPTSFAVANTTLASIANSLRIHLVSRRIGVSLIEPGCISPFLVDKQDVAMARCLQAADAAKRIVAGLEAGKDYLRLPRQLSWFGWLVLQPPSGLWRQLVALLAGRRAGRSKHSSNDGDNP